MKKIAVILGLLLFVDYQVQAEEPLDVHLKDAPFIEEDTTITASLSQYEDGYERYKYYRMVVEEDSLVTFTVDDTSKTFINILYAEPSRQGQIVWLNATDEDGNDTETIHNIQLKAGTYGILLSGLTTAPYKASYTFAPLENQFDLEPNEDLEDANPIEVNTVIEQVTTSGDLYHVDKYVLEIEKPSIVSINGTVANKSGNRIHVSMTKQGSNMYSFGRQIDAGDEWKQTSGWMKEVLAPGTYYIDVMSWHSVFDRQYRFEIEQQEILNPQTFKLGYDDTPVQLNTLYRGFMSRNDNYTFSIEEPQNIAFVVNSDAAVQNELSITVERYSEEHQMAFAVGEQKFAQSSRLEQTLQLQPGQYTIQLKSSVSETFIPYTIGAYIIPFSDVQITQRYYHEIMKLVNNGIIQGYSDGTFKPKQIISRKQVFTMLSRDQNVQLTKIRSMITFQDIAQNSASATLIQPFYEAGIIDGSNGNMNLSDHLTRGQLAKILVNAYKLDMKNDIEDFKDVSPTNGAYEYIKILASNGITTGNKGNFMPNEAVSREHFAAFLSRIQ